MDTLGLTMYKSRIMAWYTRTLQISLAYVKNSRSDLLQPSELVQDVGCQTDKSHCTLWYLPYLPANTIVRACVYHAMQVRDVRHTSAGRDCDKANMPRMCQVENLKRTLNCPSGRPI